MRLSLRQLITTASALGDELGSRATVVVDRLGSTATGAADETSAVLAQLAEGAGARARVVADSLPGAGQRVLELAKAAPGASRDGAVLLRGHALRGSDLLTRTATVLDAVTTLPATSELIGPGIPKLGSQLVGASRRLDNVGTILETLSKAL